MPRMTGINIFKHASDAQLLDAGALLFSEGDQGDEVMFAVVDGEVDLSRNGSVIETVGPGGILGELALIDPAPARQLRLHAPRHGSCASIKSISCSWCTNTPRFALQVMRVMAERIRKTNEASTAARAE